jgi:hypothetical protein
LVDIYSLGRATPPAEGVLTPISAIGFGSNAESDTEDGAQRGVQLIGQRIVRASMSFGSGIFLSDHRLGIPITGTDTA